MTTTHKRKPVPKVDDWTAKIERLRHRKPAEAFLTIPDPEALAAVDEARSRWLEARRLARRGLPAAGSLSVAEVDAFIDDDEAVQATHADVEEAVEVARDAEIVFHFRALPPDVYERLPLAHPPTADQEAEDMGHNPDTYIPALIAACSVKPLTPEQVTGLITPQPDPDEPDGPMLPPALNAGDVAALVQSCRDVNERPRMMLGKGSRPTSS